MMTYEIAELRKKFLRCIRNPLADKAEVDVSGKSEVFMRDATKIERYRKKERRVVDDIVVEVISEEENGVGEKRLQVVKSARNLGKVVNCVRKMGSLESKEEQSPPTLKGDNRS